MNATSIAVSAQRSLNASLGVLQQRLVAVVSPGNDRAVAQRDALLAFSVRVASAALLYLSQIALARWMGDTEYGIYVFVWTWVLILGGLSPLGLTVVAVRLIPEYRERGLDTLRRGLVRGSQLFVLGVGTLIALLGLAGLWLLEQYIVSPYILPGYLALACIPLYALTDVQDGIARGHGWVETAIVPPFIVRPLLVLLVMAGSFAAGLPMQATTAAGAAIVATWCAAILQSFMIQRRLDRISVAKERSYDVARWTATAAPLFVMGSADLALQNADILVISRYMTPADVAIYFAAAKTMSLILFVHFAVSTTVAHRFSGLSARGDKEGLKASVRDAVNWIFWPSLAGAVLILALGAPLLSLFGPHFVDAYPVMFIIVIGYLFRSAMGPVDQLLNMLGEQKLYAGVLVATLVLNVTLNLLLVPVYGLVGAATATAAALTFSAFLSAEIARRRLGISIAIWRNLPRR